MLNRLFLIVALMVMAVGVCGSAQGTSIALFDDFDGTAGSTLDTVKWWRFPAGAAPYQVTLDGVGNAVHDASADTANGSFQESVDTFLYEPLEFRVSAQSAAHGLYGFQAPGSDDSIMIRADLGLIVVRKSAVTEAFPAFNFKGLSSALVNIEWSATQLRVLVDGFEELNITDPAKIPNVAMAAYFRTYNGAVGNPPGTIDFDYVQVGTAVIPEPATLGLLGMGGLILLLRKRK